MIIPGAMTRALYESMPTEQLLDLQAAFEADQAAATSGASIMFGAGRLALIAEVLARRDAE